MRYLAEPLRSAAQDAMQGKPVDPDLLAAAAHYIDNHEADVERLVLGLARATGNTPEYIMTQYRVS